MRRRIGQLWRNRRRPVREWLADQIVRFAVEAIVVCVVAGALTALAVKSCGG